MTDTYIRSVDFSNSKYAPILQYTRLNKDFLPVEVICVFSGGRIQHEFDRTERGLTIGPWDGENLEYVGENGFCVFCEEREFLVMRKIIPSTDSSRGHTNE